MANSDTAFRRGREAHYRGRAKIWLRNLQPEQPAEPGNDRINEKVVDTLKHRMQREGCLRYEPENAIPVLISEETLQIALQASNCQQSDLLGLGEPALLELGDTRIVYLHGRHRIEAAKWGLDRFDSWWVAELYSTGLGDETKRSLREQSINSFSECHGYIYRNLRHYQKSGMEKEANRWFTRFSDSTQRDMTRFLTKRPYQAVRDALDALLPFPGLWPAFQAGILRRIFTMRCFEEFASYLRLVYKVWAEIIGDPRHFALVDYDTVESIQLFCPSRSQLHYDEITRGVRDGCLFRHIRDGTIRQGILERLLRQRSMIPSLYTYHEDTKWLEVPFSIVRTLLEPDFKGSLRSGLTNSFVGMREAEFEEIYLKLHLFAWRHWTDLSSLMPRKDKDQDLPKPKTQNPVKKHRLFKLAVQGGIDSAHIAQLLAEDPESGLISEFIDRMRPPEFYDLSSTDRATLRDKILMLFEVFIAKEGGAFAAQVEQNVMSTDYRCGRPYSSSWEVLRRFLTYERILYYHETDPETLNVFRDIFRAFFNIGYHERVNETISADTAAIADTLFDQPDNELMREAIDEVPENTVQSNQEEQPLPLNYPQATEQSNPFVFIAATQNWGYLTESQIGDSTEKDSKLACIPQPGNWQFLYLTSRLELPEDVGTLFILPNRDYTPEEVESLHSQALQAELPTGSKRHVAHNAQGSKRHVLVQRTDRKDRTQTKQQKLYTRPKPALKSVEK